MNRVTAVVISLCLLVPLRMSTKLSGDASKTIETVAGRANREAGRRLKKVGQALKANSGALAKSLRNDVGNMRDAVGDSVEEVKELLEDVIPEKGARRSSSAGAKHTRSGITVRRGIDLSIGLALACLLIKPKRRVAIHRILSHREVC